MELVEAERVINLFAHALRAGVGVAGGGHAFFPEVTCLRRPALDGGSGVLWLPFRYNPCVSLEELRCPNCGAPAKAVHGNPGACAFCGTLLVDRTTDDGPTEERFSLKLRVGLSNRQRIADLLCARLGVSALEARGLVEDSSVELEVGRDAVAARQLARDVAEAGAQAELVARRVRIPMVGVMLDAAGSKKLAVIVALRAHVELTVGDAKRLVEEAPSVVAPSLEQPRAQALADALVAAGARARVF